jgi:hypothetical protein
MTQVLADPVVELDLSGENKHFGGDTPLSSAESGAGARPPDAERICCPDGSVQDEYSKDQGETNRSPFDRFPFEHGQKW